MSLRYARARYAIAALVALGVVALPASANAWTWGYNYVGPSVNSTVVAGWNYWSSAHASKLSGGSLYHYYQSSGGQPCYVGFSASSWDTSPAACGFGGYVYSEWGYESGATSYVQFTDN